MRPSFSIRSGSSGSVRLEAAVAGGEAEREVAARALAHPPVRAIPKPARRATRSHWPGRSGASVASRTMIEPAPSGASGSGTPIGPDALADGDAVDAQPGAPAVVRLHEHAERPAVLDDPGGRADPALEAVADHARAAADRALLDGAAVVQPEAPPPRAPA